MENSEDKTIVVEISCQFFSQSPELGSRCSHRKRFDFKSEVGISYQPKEACPRWVLTLMQDRYCLRTIVVPHGDNVTTRERSTF